MDFLNKAIILLIFFLAGCTYKTYVFTSQQKIKRSHKIKVTEKHRLVGERIIRKQYTFILPQSVCDSADTSDITIYMKPVYRKVNRSWNKDYAEKIKVDTMWSNDTLTFFNFPWPNPRDVGHIYEYNRRKCMITYIKRLAHFRDK